MIFSPKNGGNMTITIEVKVPALGESISSATVASINVKAGDHVNVDDVLMELETDKITTELPAPVSGTIQSIHCSDGDEIDVGTVVMLMTESSKNEKADKTEVAETIKIQNHKAQQDTNSNTSPAAAKIIREQEVNITQGTGKKGMITKEDLLSSNTQSLDSNHRSTRRIKMTKLRSTIALHLKNAQNTAAILTTYNEVDMSNVMHLRSLYKDRFIKTHDVKLGFMSFFIKASIYALQRIPMVNAQIDGNEIVHHDYCDISVAIGTEKGLITPVLRNAESMSFAEIEKQIISYAQNAQNNTLKLDDLRGGTFTISNGGTYGSLMSSPILNYPQSAVLGMHKTQDRPVVVDGDIKIRPMMYLALSYDHRIVDGKNAVTFLVKIKEVLENPGVVLLDL